jgi:hypothetical protein
MTSGKMESPLWKKLQQQQQQQNQLLNNQNVNNFMLNNNLSNDHQQQQHQNQAILNQNMTDLNQIFMANNNTTSLSSLSALQNNGNNFYKNGRSSSSNSNNLNNNFTSNVEYGVVERILNSYGFIKALNKEQRLFFPYTYQHQNDLQLKIGDMVEYEETVDQRNGKPLAINIVKQNISNNSQSAQSVQLSQQINDQHQQVATIMNLKELLLKNTNNSINGGGGSVEVGTNVGMNGQYLNQQEQSYQYLMNGLKMLNIQQQQQQQQQAQIQMNSNSNATNNLNSLLSLFTNNNNANSNGNINMMSAPKSNIMTLNEKNDNIISNEHIEGFIVGQPSKRPALYVSYIFLL